MRQFSYHARRPGRRVIILLSLVLAAMLLTTGIGLVHIPRPLTSEFRNRIGHTGNLSGNPYEVAQAQVERQRLLHAHCANYTRPSKPFSDIRLRNLYVNDDYKLLYCEVPKVACTNWKRILLVLSGKVNTTDPSAIGPADVHGRYMRHLRKLHSYSPDETKRILKDYYKFVFVRHPLERLLSAYISKLERPDPDYFPGILGTEIVRKYRARPSNASLSRGHDVTFNEFVQYLIDPESYETLNDHWLQFTRLCHPCLVQYDFVGKYETLNDDTNFVLEKLGVAGKVKFAASRRPASRSRTGDLLKEYLNTVSRQDLLRLRDVYALDFSMFGYEI